MKTSKHFPVRVHYVVGHLTIEDVARIRRKVDKATKRADENIDLTISSREQRKKLLLGENPCSFGNVYKGDYSPCYPDSIGKTTATRQLPSPGPITTWDAQNAAHGYYTSPADTVIRLTTLGTPERYLDSLRHAGAI